MKIIWVVGIMVGIIFLYFLGRNFKKPVLNTNSTMKSKNASIFVIVPFFMEVSFVDDLFQKANIPSRIFLGIGTICQPQANVRCLSLPKHCSASVARQQIAKNLYQQEDYILTLHPKTLILTNGWDDILIQHSNETKMLSVWNVPKNSVNHLLTFPVFDSWNKLLPHFTGFVSSTKKTCNFEIFLANFQFLFASANLMLPFLKIGLPFLSECEDNFLISYECFAANILVYNVPIQIETDIQPFVIKPTKKDVKLFEFTQSTLKDLFFNKSFTNKNNKKPLYITQFDRQKSSTEFFEFLGIDSIKKKIADKIKLGLFGNYSTFDILCRFETLELFYELKSKF